MEAAQIEAFENLLPGMDPVSLAELDLVSLLDRQDTKYVFPIAELPGIMAAIQDQYRVLEINGKRLFSYESVYYDTDDLLTYFMHHNLRPGRFKVRVRKYVESHTAFVEIKTRSIKGRTVKKRIGIQENEAMELGKTAMDFVARNAPIDASLLSPVLKVDYKRFTLVDKEFTERVTIDLGLSCRSLRGPAFDEFSGMVIAEVKQLQFSRRSPLVRAFGEHRILPMKLSKYCLGILACYPGIKYNRFKKKLLKLQRITGKHINHYLLHGNL